MDIAFCRMTILQPLKALVKKQHFRCVISTKSGRRFVLATNISDVTVADMTHLYIVCNIVLNATYTL